MVSIQGPKLMYKENFFTSNSFEKQLVKKGHKIEQRNDKTT
jgi:hypothetical protein